MQFRGRRRSGRVPNLTPLIDIVFLLLVFFMLTSHFVREDTITVDLPVAESGEPLDHEGRLEVVLDGGGRILFNNHFVKPDRLETVLRDALNGRADKVVRVRGDRAATLETTVAVLDAARNAGAEAVDVVTERK